MGEGRKGNKYNGILDGHHRYWYEKMSKKISRITKISRKSISEAGGVAHRLCCTCDAGITLKATSWNFGCTISDPAPCSRPREGNPVLGHVFHVGDKDGVAGS